MDYVNAHKSVDIYKPFYSTPEENPPEYKLVNAKKAQEIPPNGSKISFLNENPIRARDNAVRKENYEGAFSNNASSQISWTNVPIVNQTLLDRFNYSTGNDRADIHIHIQVPNDEPSGSKSSILTLTGWYAL